MSDQNPEMSYTQKKALLERTKAGLERQFKLFHREEIELINNIITTFENEVLEPTNANLENVGLKTINVGEVRYSLFNYYRNSNNILDKDKLFKTIMLDAQLLIIIKNLIVENIKNFIIQEGMLSLLTMNCSFPQLRSRITPILDGKDDIGTKINLVAEALIT